MMLPWTIALTMLVAQPGDEQIDCVYCCEVLWSMSWTKGTIAATKSICERLQAEEDELHYQYYSQCTTLQDDGELKHTFNEECQTLWGEYWDAYVKADDCWLDVENLQESLNAKRRLYNSDCTEYPDKCDCPDPKNCDMCKKRA